MSKNFENALNPLGQDVKREKSGSETFKKYNYQYHWAFCRLIEAHEEGNEYAIFIEEHEDVTIATSLNAEGALFELNQIKETSKKHTINSLTAGSEKKPSILSKLSSGACGKTFSEKISKINFISTGGYSFSTHKKGFNLEIITSGDLDTEELELIKNAIGDLPGGFEFSEKIAFIIPRLPAKEFDLVVEGKISLLISKIAPGLNYNANAVYECIIRDLQRKGENSFDYNLWDEALKRKSVTSIQFDEVLAKHINRKPDQSLLIELTEVLKVEYSLTFLKRKEVTRSFNRYYSTQISNRSSLITRVSDQLRATIDSLEETNPDISINELELLAKCNISSELNEFFLTPSDFTAAFLFELLNK